MHYVVTAEEMQKFDRLTIDSLGVSGRVLMENAGRAVAAVICNEFMPEPNQLVAVVAGSGNNGGDGFVIAHLLRQDGFLAEVFLAAPAASIKGDAAFHKVAYEQSGGVTHDISTPESLAVQERRILEARVVVNAVFGTGLIREVAGHWRAVLELINRSSASTVSVDIPSGLCATTGRVLGYAVRPERTVTMAFLKVGIAVAPGFARAGNVSIAEIGIPTSLATTHKIRLAMLEAEDLLPALPPIDALAHKGSRGHALLVAGSPGKRGAARLAAMAGLRSGAGLVTVVAEGVEDDAAMPDPVMTLSLTPTAGQGAALVKQAQGKAAVGLGPGMSADAGGKDWVLSALAGIAAPMVLDADALNHLGTDLRPVAARQAPTVLTPHPGEAARLLGCTVADVETDRVSAVRRLADAAQAVVVLKGARTLVADGKADGFTTINPTGSPALATAGSGDVLTGCVTACLGQGMEAALAARVAVYVHGLAGELAAAELGVRSVTASDVLDCLPAAWIALEQP